MQQVRPLRGPARHAMIPLGLGGMLGAGVFVALAPAAAAAGAWMLLAVPIAAVTALCCALTSAEQSAAYRGPGAGHACIRSKLGPVPGRIAAGMHLVGHVAAMAAIADAVGRYLPSPDPVTSVVVVLLVVVAATTGLRIRGAVAWVWLVGSVLLLALVVAACLAIEPVRRQGGAVPVDVHQPLGLTAAAGVLFFAFAGFERLTAPARERDRGDRGGVRLGLLVSMVTMALLCLVVGSVLLYQLGAVRLSVSPVPLADALRAADAAGLAGVVSVGLALAMLPVLLGVLESLRSTGLAVIGDGDLPAVLGRRGACGTPYLLDLIAGLAAVAMAVLLEAPRAIGIAACCLLVHYAFSNAAARVLLLDASTALMRTACLGMGLCVILAMSMPVPALLVTVVVALGAPLVARLVARLVAGTGARRPG